MSDRSRATGGSDQREADDDSYFAPLTAARYLLLTTFKQNGIPVSTPVQGVVDGDRAYFRAWSRSGVAKRLRHTDGVQVTPCTALGLCSFGPPLDATARPLAGKEASRAAGRLADKYPGRRRFPIPALPRRGRWQLVHYELLPRGGERPAHVAQELPVFPVPVT
jgi:PPOX class probable F420-dependent enzyme